MRVMVLVKASGVKATEGSKKSYKPTPETMEVMEAMGRFNDELHKAGILITLTVSRSPRWASVLRPMAPVVGSSMGHSLQPLELVTGFWLREVQDMDEAVAWVNRCPNPMQGRNESGHCKRWLICEENLRRQLRLFGSGIPAPGPPKHGFAYHFPDWHAVR